MYKHGRSITPGPADKPTSHDGVWAIEGDTLIVDMPAWQGSFKIECLTDELMILVKTLANANQEKSPETPKR